MNNLDYLNARIDKIVYPLCCRGLCYRVVDNCDFRHAPGSANGSAHHHHSYDGGLLAHTREVVEFALAARGALPVKANAEAQETDYTILLTAALWHDWAKIYDYEKLADGSWVKTPHARMIRHVARSYSDFVATANEFAVCPKVIRDAIGHCILAHHGRLEWGSPVEPETPLAWILHSADMWSAKWGTQR